LNLVASLIVKNELGRYLQACIGSLRDFCDLIVVVDDGSTDRTGEWLDDNADDRMVVKHLDPDDGFFAGHEGRRRQALLDFTVEQKPTHVLAIDADEFVADGALVRHFCELPLQTGQLLMQEVWKMEPSGLSIRQDGGWRPHPVPILWRCDTYEPGVWTINDRALACGREPTATRRMRRPRPTGTEILHFGWANEAERELRYQRYVEHDDGNFHNRRHLDSIMFTDIQVTLAGRKWPKGLRLKDGVVTYFNPKLV
jgi:glycosyltransferase involved in cell wall biosynthesis